MGPGRHRSGLRDRAAGRRAVLGTQVVDVVGALWAVIANPGGAKADELRRMGVNPRLAFAVNLVYSSLAVALATVMVLRTRAQRHGQRGRTSTTP